MSEILLAHARSFEDDVIDRLARIETAAGLNLATIEHRYGDHETRLRVLERASWKMAGVCSVMATLAGAAGALIEPLLKGHF